MGINSSSAWKQGGRQGENRGSNNNNNKKKNQQKVEKLQGQWRSEIKECSPLNTRRGGYELRWGQGGGGGGGRGGGDR